MPNGDSHPTLRRVCAERRRLTETQEAQLAPTVRDLCDQARSSRDLGIFHRVLDWCDCMSAGRVLLRGNGECVAEGGSRPQHPRTYTRVLRLGKETIFSCYGLANTSMSRWVSRSVWFPDPLAVLRFRNLNDRDNSHSILEWADLHFYTSASVHKELYGAELTGGNAD